MSELGRIKPRDLSHIDMSAREDVLHWCRELGCSEAGLASAVAKVGTSVGAVRKEITGRWK